MQNDFVTGTLGTAEAQSIVSNVRARVDSKEFEEILYTQDTHYTDYFETLEGKRLPVAHCEQGTNGWQLIPELPQNGFTIEKPSFGSYQLVETLTELYDSYGSIDEIEFCGVCTDICVVSNALKTRAQFPNTKITVRANCCAGVTPELHEAALKVMESCQIDVIR